MTLTRRVAPSLAPGWALLTSILWVGLVFIGGTALLLLAVRHNLAEIEVEAA